MVPVSRCADAMSGVPRQFNTVWCYKDPITVSGAWPMLPSQLAAFYNCLPNRRLRQGLGRPRASAFARRTGIGSK